MMFSDGIRPGGDLTELDGSAEARVAPRRIGRVQKKVEKGIGSLLEISKKNNINN